jgi:hypothetical protein
VFALFFEEKQRKFLGQNAKGNGAKMTRKAFCQMAKFGRNENFFKKMERNYSRVRRKKGTFCRTAKKYF